MTDFEVKDGVCIIPGGEKKIGYRAFRDCEELKSIVIPNSVKMIEASAFEDCTGLTEITITILNDVVPVLTFGNTKKPLSNKIMA